VFEAVVVYSLSTAAAAAAFTAYLVGEECSLERRAQESSCSMWKFGGSARRGIRKYVSTRSWSCASLELLLDFWLDCFECEVLPATSGLELGECESILEFASNLALLCQVLWIKR
jgi:hypothetical protein